VINSNLGPISHRLATIARNGLQCHPRSMIFMQSKRAYATSYQWLIVTLAFSSTISELWPLIAWNILLKLPQNRCRWRYGYYWQLIGNRQRPLRWYHRRPPTTYRLATIPHDWHTISRYDPSRSFKVNVFFMSFESQYATSY